MMRHTPRRAAAMSFLCFTAALLCAAQPASGAAVLLSRQSDLRASGVSAAGEYSLSNGSGDAAHFADTLLSDEAATARSMADQQSAPRMDGSGGLAGASAEGAVSAFVDRDEIDAFAEAQSTFDLVFRVEGSPALLTIGGALAAAGDGSAALRGYEVDSGDSPVSEEVNGDEYSVNRTALLSPGTYGLSAFAFARGSSGEGTAFYSLDFTLQDAGNPGPVPMPLPPAALAGLFGLAAVAGLKLRRRKAAQD